MSIKATKNTAPEADYCVLVSELEAAVLTQSLLLHLIGHMFLYQSLLQLYLFWRETTGLTDLKQYHECDLELCKLFEIT